MVDDNDEIYTHSIPTIKKYIFLSNLYDKILLVINSDDEIRRDFMLYNNIIKNMFEKMVKGNIPTYLLDIFNIYLLSLFIRLINIRLAVFTTSS